MDSPVHRCLLCPLIWLYFNILWACTALSLLFYSFFQWLYNKFRCSFRRQQQRQDFLVDIRTPDNVDIGEYDVIEHGAARNGGHEEAVAFGPGPSTSQGPTQRLCPKNKSDPVPIPRKPKPKKESFEPYQTSSKQPTARAEKMSIHELILTLVEDHLLPPIETSPPQSPAEASPIFSMSDVE